MITAVKQFSKFKPNIGDINLFKDNNILIPLPENDFNRYIVGMYSFKGNTPFECLDNTGICIPDIKQTYSCPHTGMTFFSLVPELIITSNLETYFEKNDEFPNRMLFDKKYQWERYLEGENSLVISNMSTYMLGSGYSCGCNWCDGFSDKILVGIELNNGDTLVCSTHEWFNK